MRRNALLIFTSVLAAAWMATGVALAQTSGTSKSDRSGDTGSGTGQSGQTIHPSPKGTEGGSRSERTGESNVPLPQGSRQSGTVETGKSGGSTPGSSGMSSESPGMSGSRMGSNQGSSNIKEVQQALKDKGYDPGPIDGVMGTKTKEAIKSFQSASNLKATGTLNAETSEKLGVQSGGTSKSSSSMGSDSGSTRSRDSMKSSDTSKGKETDQPNQPAPRTK